LIPSRLGKASSNEVLVRKWAMNRLMNLNKHTGFMVSVQTMVGEKDFNGKKGTVHYNWIDGSKEVTRYSTGGRIHFGEHGIFMTESDDESWSTLPGVFIQYSMVIGIEFEAE
jgi:hypothetical protein